MEMIFMKTENSKTSEPDKLVLNLLQRQHYKTKKLKIIALTSNNELKNPMSHIQDYIQYIIENIKNYPLALLLISKSVGFIKHQCLKKKMNVS